MEGGGRGRDGGGGGWEVEGGGGGGVEEAGRGGRGAGGARGGWKDGGRQISTTPLEEYQQVIKMLRGWGFGPAGRRETRPWFFRSSYDGDSALNTT